MWVKKEQETMFGEGPWQEKGRFSCGCSQRAGKERRKQFQNRKAQSRGGKWRHPVLRWGVATAATFASQGPQREWLESGRVKRMPGMRMWEPRQKGALSSPSGKAAFEGPKVRQRRHWRKALAWDEMSQAGRTGTVPRLPLRGRGIVCVSFSSKGYFGTSWMATFE